MLTPPHSKAFIVCSKEGRQDYESDGNNRATNQKTEKQENGTGKAGKNTSTMHTTSLAISTNNGTKQGFSYHTFSTYLCERCL